MIFCLLLTLFGGNFRGKKGEVLPNPHLFNICLALSKAGICGKKSFRGGKGDFPQNRIFFLSLIAALTSSTVGDCQSESSCAQLSDDGDAKWRIVKQIRPCD